MIDIFYSMWMEFKDAWIESTFVILVGCMLLFISFFPLYLISLPFKCPRCKSRNTKKISSWMERESRRCLNKRCKYEFDVINMI